MSGWILLGFGALVAITDFILGLRFTRMTGAHFDGLRRIGRILMLTAPIVFLILAALAFGWIPSSGIDPISFN